MIFSLYCNAFYVKTDGNLSRLIKREKKSGAIRIGGDCTIVHFFYEWSNTLGEALPKWWCTKSDGGKNQPAFRDIELKNPLHSSYIL